MSIKLEGWFVPVGDENYFQGFWIKRTDRMYLGYCDKPIVRILSYAALFGKMEKSKMYGYEACDTSGTCNSCPEGTSYFCQKRSLHKKRNVYKKINYYKLWRNIKEELIKKEENVIKVIGRPRYESFREFIQWSALQEYNRYTNREIKEKYLMKPVVMDASFVGLEEISEDPWQQYVVEKIKEGDEECLLYLDSLFSA